MQIIDHVLLHVIFSTQRQKPVLKDDALRAAVHAAIRDKLSHSENICLAVGGTADHVHVALFLSRKMAVHKLVDHLKKVTVPVVRQSGEPNAFFKWQQSYMVFSVGLADRDALIHYVQTQEEVHRTRTFHQELLAMFAKYDVGFDERFVWK
ncbi:transposase [Terriglobus roseus]|uniref:transposase n=1 Tax=Terriglobus roseus TaxID=392734 RepID=UPI001E3E385F|nr:transposase [Terriglobus roseus]